MCDVADELVASHAAKRFFLHTAGAELSSCAHRETWNSCSTNVKCEACVSYSKHNLVMVCTRKASYWPCEFDLRVSEYDFSTPAV